MQKLVLARHCETVSALQSGSQQQAWSQAPAVRSQAQAAKEDDASMEVEAALLGLEEETNDCVYGVLETVAILPSVSNNAFI